MIEEKTRDVSEGAVSSSCKWLNIYFEKSGKAHRGNGLFDSQNAAADRMQEFVRKLTMPGRESGFM